MQPRVPHDRDLWCACVPQRTCAFSFLIERDTRREAKEMLARRSFTLPLAPRRREFASTPAGIRW
jgi:hypothetical protein